MSGRLTRAAYQGLIHGDLAWLRAQPRTLERDHIIAIVEVSMDHEYPDPDPTHRRRRCEACGKMSRVSTAGCDHCDFEDK